MLRAVAGGGSGGSSTWAGLGTFSGLTSLATLLGTDEFAMSRAADNSRATVSALMAYLSTATLPAGAITTSQPMTLTQTWNDGAVTFTGLKVNITNTASAAASMLADFQVSGVSQVGVRYDGAVNSRYGFYVFTSTYSSWLGGNGLNLAQDKYVSWSNDQVFAGADDLFLRRDAAAVLAQRNSTNAQSFRVYNTYTDASNYERAKLGWNSNVLEIGSEKAGTGSSRGLKFLSGGDNVLDYDVTNAGHWTLPYNSFIQFVSGGWITTPSGNVIGISSASNDYLYLGSTQGNGGGGTRNLIHSDTGTPGFHSGYLLNFALEGGGVYADGQTGGDLKLYGGAYGTAANNINGGHIRLHTATGTGSGTKGYLFITGLPTSSAGLPSGAVWANSNVLTIVP